MKPAGTAAAAVLSLFSIARSSAFVTAGRSLSFTSGTRAITPAEVAAAVGMSAADLEETSARTTNTLDRKPKPGDICRVDVKLTPREGFVPEPLFDSTGRIAFVLDGGNYLPGLHEVISTMLPGETVEGEILDAGWGERREDLVAKVPKEGGDGLDYDKIKVGSELFLANGVKCTVTEVTDDDFTIDANPPLAGATYSADATLLSVEEGPVARGYMEDEDNPFGDGRYEVATIALGCFWGGELEYMRVPGVVGTKVGYTQGAVENPSYQDVCSGTTGHTEAIQVVFDPDVVGYERLVQVGMERLGDSRNLLNQVGNDQGTQYRHGVYFHTKEQKEVARKVVDSYGPKCKTEILPAKVFYDAEDYHQQYLLKGGQSARKGDTETIRCYG